MIGGHKEIVVTVAGPATDEIVDGINQRIATLVDWLAIRNSSALAFGILGRTIAGSAKVMADDWDLAIYLRALKQLSTERRELVLRVAFEPEGGSVRLKGGSFGKDASRVAGFLDKMSADRPNLEGVFDRLVLDVRTKEEESFRDALAQERARFEPVASFDLESTPDGVRVVVALDGTVRQLVFVIGRLMSASMRCPDPGCDLQLEGRQSKTRKLQTLVDWLELEHELRVAVGPERSAAPVASPRSTSMPRVLGRFPEVSALMGPYDLEWQDWADESVRLERDGTLRVVAPAQTSCSPRGSMRRERGSIGDSVLVTDMTIEASGRMKFEVLLVHPSGDSVSGGSFVNVEDVLVRSSERDALLLAELDGVQQLVHMRLPSMQWSSHHPWDKRVEAQRLIRTPGGRVLVLLQGGRMLRARLQISELDCADWSLKAVARLDGTVGRVVGLDEDSLFIECTQWKKIGGYERPVEDLFDVRLKDGAISVVTAGVERPKQRRIESALQVGDEWIVCFGADGVYAIGENARKLYDPADGEQLVVAYSEAGTLAALSSIADVDCLKLIDSAGATVVIPLEIAGRRLRWVPPSEPATC